MSKSINIFIDALGWEVLNKHPWFLKEFQHRKRVEMQFGYSSAALPTIITGRYPRDHEQFSYYYHNKKSPLSFLTFLNFIPQKIAKHWRFRNKLSQVVKRILGYTGYFQLYSMDFSRLAFYDYCEKKDIFSKDCFPGVKNITDYCILSGKDYYITPWSKSEVENIADVKEQVKTTKDKFIFLYLAELDSLLHSNCAYSKKVKSKLEFYEKEILDIYELAKSYDEDVEINIMSDHGMTNCNRFIDYKRKLNLEELKLVENKDYAIVYDSTMIRFWFFNQKAKSLVIQKVKKLENGYLLSEEEKKKFGIDFNKDKYGEEIFLVDPGVLIVPSDMGASRLRGMHGYHPYDKDSYACLISNKCAPDKVKHIKDYMLLFKDFLEVV